MADNPITTPLPADLPENWSVGQIVAPSGTVAGLTEQHGYNYLMAQVNAAQESVNAIGEAFEDLATLENGKVPNSQLPVGTPNGLATLDSTGKVPKSQLPIGGPGGLATLDDAGQIDAALIPIYPWQLIDLLDNTGEMAGTWTAPDVFEGENYDLGVYEIGAGGSGGSRKTATTISGGASGYGKNFIINNVAPNTQYSYVVGAGGTGVSGNTNGKAGGTTSFNGVEADGGDGGKQGASITGASGGQGADEPSAWAWSANPYSPRRLFGCCPTISDENPGGSSQSPREGQNQFDTSMITLCAGGSCTAGSAQVIVAMPDGTKGGNGALNANGESATGHGNGGGASLSGTSGSGSDGAIYLYARRRSPVQYQVSITVLDQDDNPVDGIAINGLYSNAEGSRNGLAVTGSNGVATGISYQQQATFTTDAYTDLTAGSVSLVMTEGSVTEGTINVTFNNFVAFTSSTTARFSHYAKRVDVSAVGGGGAGGGSHGYQRSPYGCYTGQGGAGGYAAIQNDVDFAPDTDYTATVGAGGTTGGPSFNQPGNGNPGGASSFMGVTANGGAGGLGGNNSNAWVTNTGGNGYGGAGLDGGSTDGNPGTAGTQSYYDSFTTTALAGGGGGSGATTGRNSVRNGTGGEGGSPNGGKGGNSDYDISFAGVAATAGKAPGGGGGSAGAWSDDEGASYAGGAAGARGIITCRLYNTHTLPTS